MEMTIYMGLVAAELLVAAEVVVAALMAVR